MSTLLVLSFQYMAYFPGPQTLGKMPPEEQEESEADAAWCQCFLPSPPGSLLGENEELAGTEAFPWVCAGIFHLSGRLTPCVWLLYCFIKIFLCCFLSFFLGSGPFQKE